MVGALLRIPANVNVDLSNLLNRIIFVFRRVIRRLRIVVMELALSQIVAFVRRDSCSEGIDVFHSVIRPASTENVPIRIPARVGKDSHEV